MSAGRFRPAQTAAEDFGQKSGQHRRAVFQPAESAGRTARRWSGWPNQPAELPARYHTSPPHVPL